MTQETKKEHMDPCALKVTVRGPGVKEGMMDVEALMPMLLSLSRLVKAADRALCEQEGRSYEEMAAYVDEKFSLHFRKKPTPQRRRCDEY